MFKRFITIGTIVMFGAAVSAAEPGNKDSNAQGSHVGKASSSHTGNGAAIGGGKNGDGQTQQPGSRANEVQGIHASEGRGRDKE